MSEQWLSIAAAAAHLNCHTRTIERRIASGKIPTRRADDGQVQVCLDLPDMSDNPSDPILAVRELAQDQVSIATGSASALVKFAQSDAERARSELSLIREESTRVRQGARIAWGAVAVMSACICVSVGWVSYKITRANADIDSITQKSRQVELESTRLAAERDAARSEAQRAMVAQAKSEGELAALRETIEKKAVSDTSPTTRPTGIFSRIASIFGDN
jgi:outer membrane murein-binding lipoprotein Lpp